VRKQKRHHADAVRMMGEPMATPDKLSRAELALRDHALAYPETHEDFPWGHRAIKIKGKMFVVTSLEGDKLGLTVKLPHTGKSALGLPFAEPTGYGLGKSGWVTARFGAEDTIPLDMLIEWIDESFRAVAPKRVVAAWDGVEVPARPRARKKR
jgi:predicted DNA-binding protein (MmcQ/YjbR family)